MSHTEMFKTEFTDRARLCKAFERLKWKIIPNTTKRTYNGDREYDTVYPWVAVNPRPMDYSFDIGIVETDGRCQLFADMMDGSITEQLGKELVGLQQSYQVVGMEEYAAAHNGNCQFTTLPDGSIQAVMELEVSV